MLWTTAVILIIVWMLCLGSGYQMGLFIHVLYAAAVALLVVSISQEAAKSRILKRIVRRSGQNRRVNTDARSQQPGRYRHGFSGISGKS